MFRQKVVCNISIALYLISKCGWTWANGDMLYLHGLRSGTSAIPNADLRNLKYFANELVTSDY